MNDTRQEAGTSDEPEVVFLICSERSGSNLIRAVVDAHSHYCAPAPTHLADFLHSAYCYGDLELDANWSRLVSDLVRQYSRRAEFVGVEVDANELLREVRRGDVRGLYLYVHKKAMRHTKKSRLFLKENHTAAMFAVFDRHFPNAKYVFQMRDPRDYALSCKRARFDLPAMASVAHTTKIWAMDQHAALSVSHALGPERVFVQRYEDLVADPETVLRALCAFLGVDFESDLLTFNEKASAKRSAEFRGWKNLDRPFMATNTAKYRSDLSALEIRAIELRLGPLMQRFGYELDYPRPGRVMKQALSGFLLSAQSRGNLGLAFRRRDLMVPDFFSTPIERVEPDRRSQDLERTVALGYQRHDVSTPE